ncbi:MAG TPA: hypothetical protein VK772_10410, partial [Puia sp.]|nr:hypothetical protein [Puia sp.]
DSNDHEQKEFPHSLLNKGDMFRVHTLKYYTLSVQSINSYPDNSTDIPACDLSPPPLREF